ncbi:hypothetical protein IV203_003707 [Nitzschia inconspicua]|uniref:Uncharacterized protein n=1 Tax=Nitzschia inconspicua TaxID=303405 RepID=A0A9K3L3Z8_9STRA|nr:hypothetical protein IV203_003707 [Nitzschia inconspicua]
MPSSNKTDPPPSTASTKKKNKKSSSKVSSFGSVSFLDRIHTTLVVQQQQQQQQPEGRYDESTVRDATDRSAGPLVIVDVEEQLQRNRVREKERSRKQRKKIADVDPRLYKQQQQQQQQQQQENRNKKKRGKNDYDDDDDDMIDNAQVGFCETDDFFDEDLEDQAPVSSSGWKGSSRVGVSAIQGRKTIQLYVLPVNAITKKAKTTSSEILEAAHQDGVIVGVSTADCVSFVPRQLLDIEQGRSILVTSQKFVRHHEFQDLNMQQQQSKKSRNHKALLVVTAKAAGYDPDTTVTTATAVVRLSKQVASKDIRDIRVNSEWGILGGAWRGFLRRLMMWSLDNINALQLGRQLQVFLPFLTGYESYMVAQVIEALDGTTEATIARNGGASKRINKREVNYVLTIAFKNRNVSRLIVQTIGPRWDFLWHWYHQIQRNRLYDAWGQLPVIGFTQFPATENFPATRNHALASTFRIILGPGNWITRVLTQNRQGLDTDDPERNIAQNLAAEVNGFELANRNQFGTYIGRLKTNEFRVQNRLPVDESILRSFIGLPMSTMVNNGVVRVLRQISKHWHDMLSQPFGNFAHQRMEQLDPFETMRFHMPQVCVVLSSLRGRNQWDGRVLGPFLRRCQQLTTTTTTKECSALAKEMQDTIVLELSAGIAMVAVPLTSWLDAIQTACRLIEEEAKAILSELTKVEIGLRLGHDLITQVSWKIPSDAELEMAIWLHLRGKNPGALVTERRIRNALHMTTPRDKRTLMELIKQGLVKSRPAKLLMGRVKTLLQREIRREYLNEAIRELSEGEKVIKSRLSVNDWYWLEERDEKDRKSVHIYVGETKTGACHFIHADTGVDRMFVLESGAIACRKYVPVAESIVRAQKCYMDIELEHGRKFKYNAFMEFSFLRTALRRLAVVSQICCEELDNARLNLLKELQKSNSVTITPEDLLPGESYYIYDSTFNVYAPFVCKKKYTSSDPEWSKLQKVQIVKIQPQSMIVVGGGPTGLLAVIHCTESVLLTGGSMKLYESRDAFDKGGSAFERAQIVRLDARWIAMLRYHLGTGFEDVFIPASGETDAQLGNTLPTQGFIEITIKDLECMLHVEVSRLWSKGVIEVFTDSKAEYDVNSNSLTKAGENLKVGDEILRRVDPDGKPSREYYRWIVRQLVYIPSLGLDDLRVGEEYVVYVQQDNAVLPFKLERVDLSTRSYFFKALKKNVPDIQADAYNLPSIYVKGTKRHADVSTVVFECAAKGESKTNHRDVFNMNDIREEKFTLDVGHTHVVECIGKPHESKVHFQVTPTEPYGVCCIQGLKISMGMHNFGEKRWGQSLLDDFRSTNDQNTRIIGDFTKMVRQPRIAEEMVVLMNTENWQLHFHELVEDSKFRSLNDDQDPLVPKLAEAVQNHSDNATKYRRQSLQTRFFETGDNFYLGMEFTREYDKWKNETADKLVSPLLQRKKMPEERKKSIATFRGTLMHNIDRLWYEACLEVIRRGDVYNPGARRRVPKLHLINSYVSEPLGKLQIGESFRVSNKLGEKYEILLKQRKIVIVRNVEGFVSRFPTTTEVLREGDLTRSPDGNTESKVAIATFPVSHYVNYRSIRLNNETRGYVFAFLGDEQATPHFMRYSGLTGGAINAMQFNYFIQSAIAGIPFDERFRYYSQETNWSNLEVVQRGTMSNYGQDGFLRPGFSYKDGVGYIYSKVIEWIETKQDLNEVLSRDWKTKFISSMIPRGMELNDDFVETLKEDTNAVVFDFFIEEVKRDKSIQSNDRLEVALLARKDSMSTKRRVLDGDKYWVEFHEGLGAIDEASMKRLKGFHCQVAKLTEKVVTQIIDYAREAYLYDSRSSQLLNQPKSVDSIVDDFAVDAQGFANSLALSAAFSAASVAFVLYDLRRGNATNLAEIWGAIIAGLNVLLSFGTMTNIGRYKIRNEEARVLFYDNNLLEVKKAAFRGLDGITRRKITTEDNPFLVDLEEKKRRFLDSVRYYDLEDPEEFYEDYRELCEQIYHPKAVRHFQRLLSTYYIAEVYQVNSYIQEDLVGLYKACEEIHEMLQDDVNDSQESALSSHLFERINNFSPRLERSLQRGHIYWGFLKQRSLFDWDVCIVIRYFWSLLCCSSRQYSIPFSSIENETYGIIKEAKAICNIQKGAYFKRAIRDLEYLYWATRESDIASMIFLSSSLSFVVSWIFSISRIVTRLGGPKQLSEIGFWASLASAIGAILAAFHFVRKSLILAGLWCTLWGKVRTATDKQARNALGRIRGVTFIQLLLTLARLAAAVGSAVALPWSVAQNAFPDKINTDVSIPLWIALGAFCAAVGSTIFFFVVEYVVRYNLPPKLGEFVCEAFREELETVRNVLSLPLNDIDTKQAQERKTWEYVAREFLHQYRFDTVFAADRFGSILQYIQGGMQRKGAKKPRTKKH